MPLESVTIRSPLVSPMITNCPRTPRSSRVRARPGQLAERQRLGQRRHLHVLGAARVQPVTLTPRPELAGWGGHHIEMPVQDDPECLVPALPAPARVHQRAGLAAGLE